MKKIVFAIILMILPSLAIADGSCVVSLGNKTDMTREIIWTCTGDAVNGSIPNTSAGRFASEFHKYPYTLSIVIENLASDANVTASSDVYLYDKSSGGADLLQGDGVDQLDDSTRNFIRLTPNPIPAQVWLGCANQSGASGKWTATLTITQ